MTNQPKLNYKKMLEEILPLVENDFMAEMELKRYRGNFTEEESVVMSEVIGRIYLITHCLHCKACQIKYIKGRKLSTHN